MQKEKNTSFSLWEAGGVSRLGSACSLWRVAVQGPDLSVECLLESLFTPAPRIKHNAEGVITRPLV